MLLIFLLGPILYNFSFFQFEFTAKVWVNCNIVFHLVFKKCSKELALDFRMIGPFNHSSQFKFSKFHYFLIIILDTCHSFHFNINLILYHLNLCSSHLEIVHAYYPLTWEALHSFFSLILSVQLLILIFQELNEIRFLPDSY